MWEDTVKKALTDTLKELQPMEGTREERRLARSIVRRKVKPHRSVAAHYKQPTGNRRSD